MPEISLTLGIVLAAAALALGFLAAFLIQNGKISSLKKEAEMSAAETRRLSAEADERQRRLDSLSEALSENRQELAAKDAELRGAKARLYELDEKNADLAARLSELSEKLHTASANAAAMEQSYKDLREWINSADVSLKNSFASLSKDIAENNTKVFLETANDKLSDFAQKLGENLKGNNEAVSGIITPVGNELKELRNKVEEIEKARASAYSGLTAQVDVLKKQNSELQDATNLLNSTLKNNAQRGKWGEEQLRKIAELAGMVEHIDFEEQQVNADGSRPDMVINLTGNRTIPVDSKVPMNSYMLYLDDTDEQSRARHLSEHVRALRAHIDTLNKKAYWKSEERSAEMVAMVVPYESGLSAAFASDRDIFSYAMEKNVLLLSPMTFYAFLKSVSIGWQENAMSKNAREIAALSKELIDRFNVFFGYFGNIDKALMNARDQYDKAVRSYNSRLTPTFNRFKALSSGMDDEKAALVYEDEAPSLSE